MLASVAVVSLVGVGLVTAAALWESWQLTNPSGYQHPLPSGFRYQETPKSVAGLDFEEISYPVGPASQIRGWLVPARANPKRLAVVFLHGRGGDRRNVLPLLAMLHSAGATVAAIDLRENGLSDGRGAGTGLAMREAEDAVAAANAMRKAGYEHIVLMGCSLGASAAILAAAHDPRVAGVIADSGLASIRGYLRDTTLRRLSKLGARSSAVAEAFSGLVVWVTRLRLGLARIEDPIAAVSSQKPILLIHGTHDTAVPAQHSIDLGVRAGSVAEVWLVENAGHCNAHVFDAVGYQARLTRFLGALSGS